jgi:hypothetical protein
MKRVSQSRRVEKQSEADPDTDAALAAIREQFLRLDPDEQRVLRRIVRQAERLDLALADLHLFLPVVEICFYGIRADGNTGQRLTPQRLRRLLRRWAIADRRDPHSESSG